MTTPEVGQIWRTESEWPTDVYHGASTATIYEVETWEGTILIKYRYVDIHPLGIFCGKDQDFLTDFLKTYPILDNAKWMPSLRH